MNNKNFEALVFAGGGGRCIWQVGFWSVVSQEIKQQPRVICAASAGAAMACVFFSGGFSRAYDFFIEAATRNRKNVYPLNLFRKASVFPHTEIYRSALMHSITEEGFEKLKKGPEIRIMLTRPPSKTGPRLATFLGIGAYSIEKMLKNPVHPEYSRKLGFKHEMAKAGECETREELADLILSSSCTPPFTPLMRWKGGTALDGGIVDNVPVSAADDIEGDLLVLLTRKYPSTSIPSIEKRVYIQPSEPIGIAKWDYTNPQGIKDAFEQGKKDGEKFIRNT